VWEHAAEETVRFADLLVKVGHRESDTVANGRGYYREALRCYLMPLKILGDDYHSSHHWIEDRVLLLLVILGGDESHTKAWCTETGSMRKMSYLPPNQVDTRDWEYGNLTGGHSFELGGYAANDITFQAMLLLSQMKLLVTYQQNLVGLLVYEETMQKAASSLGYTCTMEDIANNIYPYLAGESRDGEVQLVVLPEQIRTIVSALRFHNNGAFLAHLRDSIPFKKEHAPALFRPGVQASSEHVPEELWMVYRDCFFDTPDLLCLLRDFIPEEEQSST